MTLSGKIWNEFDKDFSKQVYIAFSISNTKKSTTCLPTRKLSYGKSCEKRSGISVLATRHEDDDDDDDDEIMK